MGNGCVPARDSDPAAEAHSKEIEKTIRTERDEVKHHMKLLLLGTGDSGKSTFAKQMILVHSNGGLSDSLITSFVPILRENCLQGITTLLAFHHDSGRTLSNPEAIKLARQIEQAQTLTPAVADDILALWTKQDVRQQLLEKADAAQLQGGVAGVSYYLDNAQRFANPDFHPTTADVLAARRKTTGIVETTFVVQRVKFTLVDVGGQRSERKKWLHCFGSVTAVIFLTAINEFDMYLEEDLKTNRLVESLKLWTALTSSQFFKQTPFILFLNKSDIFQEKIQRIPLKTVFSDYAAYAASPECKDMNEFEKGWRYISKQYSSHFVGCIFYAHLTCAVDTEACSKIFASVRETLLRDVINRAGFV
jgi:GTPase SAR1 family protein